MAVLGLDLGERRIGVAANLVGSLVVELPTIEYSVATAAVSAIGLLVQEREIATIVVGTPRVGTPLESFVVLLVDRLPGVELVQLDEALTTKEAERQAGTSADTDAIAARLILEQYLAMKEQV
ncbi:MAG: Holliday junction resolvase RuvX [Patescibacteria group bacterium]